LIYNKIELGFDLPFSYRYKASELGIHFRNREYDRYEIKNNQNMNDLEDHLAALQSPGAVMGGLVLVHESIIDSDVSSYLVEGVFSSRHDSYKILVQGGSTSAAANIRMRLGSTSTGYYGFYQYGSYATGGVITGNDSNATYWNQVGNSSTGYVQVNMDIHSPYLSDQTTFSMMSMVAATTGGGVFGMGYLNNTTSYTDFTLSPVSGTFTGATVKVYGYRKTSA